MAVTREQALAGGEFHYAPKCSVVEGPRGGRKETVVRVRASGACQTWKTRPQHFKLPIKHGLYTHGYITHENAGKFHRAEDCPCGIR